MGNYLQFGDQVRQFTQRPWLAYKSFPYNMIGGFNPGNFIRKKGQRRQLFSTLVP